MYTNKWVDFTIKDLTWDEETLYTQEVFEEMCDDKFVSMKLDDEDKPKYICTKKFSFMINTFCKVGIGSPAIIGVPRNPDWNK